MILVNGMPMEPGCYADGSQGMTYAEQRAMELARDYAGLDKVEEYRAAAEDTPAGDSLEATLELTETATDALNGVTEGGYWDWDGTSLVLYPKEEGE